MTFESRMVINIDELPKWILEKTRLEIGKHAFAIQANTAVNAPVDTGALKNSIKAEKENENMSWILPEVDQYYNEKSNAIEVEMALPGIKADTIIIKALPEWFNLTARRDKYEYRANAGFLDEIVPEKVTAEYQNG